MLCGRFELPLLRINARYLPRRYRDMAILTWFVEVWFAQKGFEEAQASGQIEPWEPFIPQNIVSIPGQKNRYPLWLSATARVRIQEELYSAGKVLDSVPSQITSIDDAGNYHAIAFLRVDDQQGVIAETGMRSQLFPVLLYDAIDEIVINDLFDRLTMILEAGEPGTPKVEIESRIAEFVASYGMVHSSLNNHWRITLGMEK